MRVYEKDGRMLLCRMRSKRKVLSFRLLETWRNRMQGLLGTDCGAEPVALVPCSSIHTLGMRYSLDVALVSRSGLVLKARRNVEPGRLVSAPGARYALERPCSKDPWPETGSLLSIAVLEHAEGYAHRKGVHDANGRRI